MTYSECKECEYYVPDYREHKSGTDTEKLYENENGYVYPFEDGYKVYWKNERFKPDVDIKFAKHWEAYYYLCSVNDFM